MVGYKSTNIYQVYISIKKKVIFVKDIIFDKNMIWDRKLILYFDNDIKELDKAIIYIEIPKSETPKIKDI